MMEMYERLSERLDAQDEKLEKLYKSHEDFSEFTLLVIKAGCGPAAAEEVQEFINVVKAAIKTRRGAP